MEIRKLLRGYGIRNFNLSNSTQVMVILTLKNDASALEPAKTIKTVH